MKRFNREKSRTDRLTLPELNQTKRSVLTISRATRRGAQSARELIPIDNSPSHSRIETGPMPPIILWRRGDFFITTHEQAHPAATDSMAWAPCAAQDVGLCRRI
jgi:hypothetical protein